MANTIAKTEKRTSILDKSKTVKTDKNAIIKESELKALLESKNIYYLKTRFLSNRPEITLDMTEREFVQFLSMNKIPQVFVVYRYYDVDEMIINHSMLNNVDMTDIPRELMEKAVNRYNNIVKKLDFESPKSITMMAIVDNREVAINRINNWVDSVANVYSNSDQAFCNVMDKLSVEVTGMTQNELSDKQLMEEAKQKDEMRRQLFEYLMEDNVFLGSMSSQSRYNYANNIIKKAKELPFLFEFIDEDGEYDVTSCVTFLNMIWRLRKKGIISYDAVKKYI